MTGIIFKNAVFLWLLAAVPVFFILYAVKRRMRRGRIRKFGDEELVEGLMPSRSGAKGWTRMVLFSLAFIFLVLGVARPQVPGRKVTTEKKNGIEVMICLDVSNSMLAEDYSPNRLDRAKRAISRLASSLKDDRLGLVIFAGQPFVQIPITTAYGSFSYDDSFMKSITTESIPVQGTDMGAAIEAAAKCFGDADGHSRAIIIITDGENHEDDPVAAATAAAAQGIKVYTIGVGSPDGTVIPLPDGGLMKDDEGNTVVTKLDEKILQDVAKAGSGAYIHAGTTEFGLGPVTDDIRKMEGGEYEEQKFEDYTELFMWFLAISLGLFAVEVLIGERKPRVKLFERK